MRSKWYGNPALDRPALRQIKVGLSRFAGGIAVQRSNTRFSGSVSNTMTATRIAHGQLRRIARTGSACEKISASLPKPLASASRFVNKPNIQRLFTPLSNRDDNPLSAPDCLQPMRRGNGFVPLVRHISPSSGDIRSAVPHSAAQPCPASHSDLFIFGVINWGIQIRGIVVALRRDCARHGAALFGRAKNRQAVAPPVPLCRSPRGAISTPAFHARVQLCPKASYLPLPALPITAKTFADVALRRCRKVIVRSRRDWRSVHCRHVVPRRAA